MGTTRVALIALIAIAAMAVISCGNSSSGPTPSPYDPEGSVENPVDLGDPESAPLVYYGEVDTTGSVYEVDVDPTHAPGYRITLTDLLDDANLWALYDHEGNYVYSLNVGNADEELDAFPTGPILYIVVIGQLTQQGTTFTLTITKN